MSTIGDIKSQIANYLKKQVSDFSINSGDETVDMLLLAINNASMEAQRGIDFFSSQLNAYLAVAAAGGNINNATLSATAQTSGLLVIGQTYVITTFVASDNFTNVGGTNSTGSVFVATGTTPTNWTHASSLQAVVNLKTVDNVNLPISGAYLPVEFLDNETFLARLQQQLGRNWVYSPSATLATIGYYSQNPFAVQQGQTINLYPSTGATITFPITVQLDAIQFLNPYIADSQTDFITLISPNYLMWQGILEGNKLWSEFVKVEEGVVNEESIGQMAQTALQTLIAWDQGVAKGVTAKEQPAPPMFQNRPKVQRQAA